MTLWLIRLVMTLAIAMAILVGLPNLALVLEGNGSEDSIPLATGSLLIFPVACCVFAHLALRQTLLVDLDTGQVSVNNTGLRSEATWDLDQFDQLSFEHSSGGSVFLVGKPAEARLRYPGSKRVRVRALSVPLLGPGRRGDSDLPVDLPGPLREADLDLRVSGPLRLRDTWRAVTFRVPLDWVDRH
ncbi:MAG: hypothetical protein AAF467_09215 [Actinomycetota bacterium]